MHTLTTLAQLLKNKDGATAIEYGLIAALIAVAAVAAMTTRRHQPDHPLYEIATSLNAVTHGRSDRLRPHGVSGSGSTGGDFGSLMASRPPARHPPGCELGSRWMRRRLRAADRANESSA